MSRATIVTDLGFGDAGKGSIVDYLAREDSATAVVRYNGGAQAGHNVVTSDGRHHTFNQFGSGTFVPGVVTHLSHFSLVSPLSLYEEAARLAKVGVTDALDRVTIDENATVVTPYHRAANRLREIARAEDRHGSCGEGIGETVADSIKHPELTLRIADLLRPHRTAQLLEDIRQYKLFQLQDEIRRLRDAPAAAIPIHDLTDNQLTRDVFQFYAWLTRSLHIVSGDYLGEMLATHEHVVFEGAQGVLLDEWYGFHPYTTWSSTTTVNAESLLMEAGFYAGDIKRFGVLRAFPTRHGPGPFVTEDADLAAKLQDQNNGFNDWQRDFRVGYFDFVAARYALEVTFGVDALAITNLDRLYGINPWYTCAAYKYQNRAIARLPVKPDREDLVTQELLTHQLEESTPILVPFRITPFESADVERYVGYIENVLGVPVEITSTGPTAADKHVLSAVRS